MRHPYLLLSKDRYPKIFWSFLVCTIIFLIIMNSISQPLITSQAPLGIVSFELSGSYEKSSTILDSWKPSQKLIASFSLGLDYLFIFLYSTTVGLSCVWTSRMMANNRLSLVGIFFAWMQWAAAISDSIENLALFRMVLTGPGSTESAVALFCAVIKFGILFIGIAWSVVASIILSIQRK